MSSFRPEAAAEPAPEDVAASAAARRLCAADVHAVARCGGGGNNRVYRIVTAAGTYALKSYGPPEPDRDRLVQEFDGLRFLREFGSGAALPEAIAVDRAERYALYAWIEGAVPAEHDARDIARALDLMAALHRARDADAALALPAATEAVLCFGDLRDQIARRFDRLATVTPVEPELAAFVERELHPEFARLTAGTSDPARSLDRRQRTLSASDFGFHNALRLPDGSLTFIDFEYFGWDDPVKLTADFLWHPGMRLDRAERDAFVAGAGRIYGDDPDFPSRLATRFPLFGIRWALIVLNEFLPQVWARRRFSGRGGDWDVAKREQLLKARTLLSSVRGYREGQYS